ncbi:MAG: ethanolamine utilization protein EutH [Ruminococcaceae bacterium]|nr:ethanolamine utilization protein EutH [Oscillospiraceae bacterium]
MNVGTVITLVMLGFALIGAADRAIGCRFGPGKSFERGFEASGPLMLAMIGPFALAPLVARILAPTLAPVCDAVGIDPSVIAGLFIANDSGGWPLAMAVARDEVLGRFFGSIVGSTMGCAVMFAFPAGFAMTPKEKRPLVAKGLAVGLITVPVACFASGLCFGIGIAALLRNLLPLIVFSGFFAAGLLLFERITVKIVSAMGAALTFLFTAALAVSVFIKVTGKDPGWFGSFDEAVEIIGGIAVFLCGAFVLLWFLEKLCGPLFEKLGNATGTDKTSVLGIVTTTINAIPMFAMTMDMNDRGVVLNIAYLVPASFMLGDHLAFQLTVDSSTALPFLAGKLAGGAAAIALALLLTRKSTEKK